MCLLLNFNLYLGFKIINSVFLNIYNYSRQSNQIIECNSYQFVKVSFETLVAWDKDSWKYPSKNDDNSDVSSQEKEIFWIF